MWPEDLERLEEARDVVESSFENGEPRPSLETLEEVARALLVRFREKYDQRIFDAFYRFTYRLFASYTDRTIKKLRARVERDAVTDRLYELIIEKLFVAEGGLPLEFLFPWCYRAIVNLAREENRKAMGGGAALDPEVPDRGESRSAVEELIAREDRYLIERLQQRIIEMLHIGEEGLNDRDRELMRLYHIDGLSQKDIAARTGLTQSNVGVILKRTRDRIQKILMAHPSWKDPFAEE